MLEAHGVHHHGSLHTKSSHVELHCVCTLALEEFILGTLLLDEDLRRLFETSLPRAFAAQTDACVQGAWEKAGSDFPPILHSRCSGNWWPRPGLLAVLRSAPEPLMEMEIRLWYSRYITSVCGKQVQLELSACLEVVRKLRDEYLSHQLFEPAKGTTVLQNLHVIPQHPFIPFILYFHFAVICFIFLI